MIVFLPRTWEIRGPVTGNCSSICAFVPLGLSSGPEQSCVFRTGLGWFSVLSPAELRRPVSWEPPLEAAGWRVQRISH